MTDYLYGRVYQRDSADNPLWERTHHGKPDVIKSTVKGLIELHGQPLTKNLVESAQSDVILVTWANGIEARICFDKEQNYNIILCPTCARRIEPPHYAHKGHPCTHGWIAKWYFDDDSNTWMCDEVIRGKETR